MALPSTISISLPFEVANSLHEAVERGDYASTSEAVGEALREWTDRRGLREEGLARLQSAWSAARVDGSPGTYMDEVLGRLESKYSKLANSGT